MRCHHHNTVELLLYGEQVIQIDTLILQTGTAGHISNFASNSQNFIHFPPGLCCNMNLVSLGEDASACAVGYG
jgi:hypothetical protein